MNNHLVTNQLDQWGAAYAGTTVILTPFKRASDGTRKQAIRRAQVQYEFDCEHDKALWIKAE